MGWEIWEKKCLRDGIPGAYRVKRAKSPAQDKQREVPPDIILQGKRPGQPCPSE